MSDLLPLQARPDAAGQPIQPAYAAAPLGGASNMQASLYYPSAPPDDFGNPYVQNQQPMPMPMGAPAGMGYPPLQPQVMYMQMPQQMAACCTCQAAATTRCETCHVPLCAVHVYERRESQQDGNVIGMWRRRICAYCLNFNTFLDYESRTPAAMYLLLCCCCLIPCLAPKISEKAIKEVQLKVWVYNKQNNVPMVIRLERGNNKYQFYLYPHNHPEFINRIASEQAAANQQAAANPPVAASEQVAVDK
ncbi:hypothetical protein CAOG_08508 [Capsaspora owczarzaki ATCC 30864]|uniref:LITAF domain-containing protein n=1 Tax=Capsaspora owczarzaki (strain ATCC 30864) TaxID=595528 RepID=A0A0D2WKE1_CAPO3|nr:hypothetical protein CAOG_08508 [Capsaspora owczarzaki ATCC 30864]KJE90043.1 hypothetical protein CAOG_008508 [Capsaspora owczarzaki ATCC 30864]|eukprot:XP_011270090.1 hypothetical protein CAOG_08508 [Capsaspora owczarzaki ATCC 30864]